jgi:TonB-linked SusC/RagA family outer membrane protein
MKLNSDLDLATITQIIRRHSLQTLFLLTNFLFINQGMAQRTVQGIIQADDGEPLVGVNILVKGTSSGTVTDLDGSYSISVDGSESILQYSYTGYVSQEEIVGSRSNIDITLEPDIETLSEITVVGYGSQRRSDLTGAISSIRAEEISSFPIARVDQALQGKSSGVYVLNTDGSPGGNAIIRIRGNNSINGGNEPLVVIDGLQGGNLNSLNPNDIQAIEILKDASATAIYGSRGANGVIIVTTKLGKEGKPVIDAGYNVGFQQLLRKLPVMSAPEYAGLVNLIRSKETSNGNVPVPVFSDADIARFKANGGTDWQDVVYETGVMHNAQLGISGGTKGLKYLISGNYLDHQGILINSAYTRASLRANVSADITDKVDFGLNWNFTKENATSPDFKRGIAFVSQVVNTAARWAPTEPVYDEDGSYHRHGPYGPSDTWNPLASAVEPVHDNPLSRNNTSMYLNFKPLTGLSLKIIGGGLFENAFQRSYQNLKTLTGTQNNGRGSIAESAFERYQNSNILTYDREWINHHLTFTGLFEQIWEEFKSDNTIANNFLVDDLGFDNLGGASSVTVSSSHSKRTLQSWMGRMNYIFKDRYLLTMSFRADASSVFGTDNKWGYFPSASVAWRVSQEPFMAGLGVDLKIRASWGKTGNQGINPYQSLARLSSGGDLLYPYSGNATTNIGFGIGGLANPNLKWETTAQTNIGIDLSLYEGRLVSTIDLYKKTTDDLLMPRELPGYVGVPSVLDNIGSVENKGIEVTVGGDPIIGDFSWNTSLNLTINRNKVLDLGADNRIAFNTTTGGYNLRNFMVLEVGQPFGTMTGYVFEGIWGTAEEEEARSYGQLPGMQKFKDLDGDGDVDVDDRTIIGNGYPDYTIGWSNSLTYKNWGLSFMFLTFQGVDLFNTLRIRREVAWEGNDPRMLNYWTPENQNTNMPAYLDGQYVQDQGLVNKYFLDGNESSRYVENASFIRLKTLQLSHTVSKRWLEKTGLSNLKIFASGTNLFTITDYTGYDPEVAAFPENDANVGVDFSAYPPAKTYSFGLELSF